MQENEQGDTSVLTRLFAHNTWANLKLLDFCAALSDEQLDTSAVGGFGSIRDTLVHYVESEVDYVNLVTGKLPAVPPPTDRFVSFDVLRDAVRWSHDELLKLAIATREDTIVRVHDPDQIVEYPLGGLMVQVLNHSTEHRTQVATIITQLGLEPPRMSGWGYLRETGELRFRPLEAAET